MIDHNIKGNANPLYGQMKTRTYSASNRPLNPNGTKTYGKGNLVD